MEYRVTLDDEQMVIIEDVQSIENGDDEICFKDAHDKIIAIVSKNEYKAIVADKPKS